jgi:hypothetical protein
MPRRQGREATRRRILQAGLAAAVVGPAHAADNDPAVNPGVAKFSPEAVHYQPTPNDWQKCLFCTYFQAPTTCVIVTGTVSSSGWCTHFALLHE